MDRREPPQKGGHERIAMYHPIPHALVACMSEGREPRAHELEALAARVWREAFCYASPTSWASVGRGSSDHRKAIALASAAFGYLPPAATAQDMSLAA